MANYRISGSGLRRQLDSSQDCYYTDAARLFLFEEGVQNPSNYQLLEAKKYLSNIYLGFSVLLHKELTKRELDVLYRASIGERIEDIAAKLNISFNRVTQIKLATIKKLNADSYEQVISRGTRLRLLLLDNPSFINHQEINHIPEVENASA